MRWAQFAKFIKVTCGKDLLWGVSHALVLRWRGLRVAKIFRDLHARIWYFKQQGKYFEPHHHYKILMVTS